MSTTGPVKWNDYDGSRISISCNSDEIIGIRASREEGTSAKASVAIDRLPEFVSALYAAAGKPEPLILDRPPVAEEGESGVNIFTVSLETRLASIGIRYHGASATAILAPGPARLLASVIAAYADEVAAASKPDPAEVRALALILSDATSPTNDDLVKARAVLRAGYKRKGKP